MDERNPDLDLFNEYIDACDRDEDPDPEEMAKRAVDPKGFLAMIETLGGLDRGIDQIRARIDHRYRLASCVRSLTASPISWIKRRGLSIS